VDGHALRVHRRQASVEVDEGGPERSGYHLAHLHEGLALDERVLGAVLGAPVPDQRQVALRVIMGVDVDRVGGLGHGSLRFFGAGDGLMPFRLDAASAGRR